MAPNPMGILNESGGELAMEMIRANGREKTFRRKTYPGLLPVLERLADDGYLEALRETPEEVTYGLVPDFWV